MRGWITFLSCVKTTLAYLEGRGKLEKRKKSLEANRNSIDMKGKGYPSPNSGQHHLSVTHLGIRGGGKWRKYPPCEACCGCDIGAIFGGVCLVV
jgi:hypothetical protein